MAEAVAGFYAVESVVEGAAAGALAVSGATVPLHARFQRIRSPSDQLIFAGSTTCIIKNKVYITGGQSPNTGNGHAHKGVHVLSFPPDFGSSRTNSTNPINVDYEFVEPEYFNNTRPLEHVAENITQHNPGARDDVHRPSWSRIQHNSVAVNDKIYLLGGLYTADLDSRKSDTANVITLDTVLVYDTLRTSYSILAAHLEKCTEGIPEPRYAASCTSSPYPPPLSVAQGEGPSLESHGTIFLHGGYDVSGSPLHDTWTFDIGTRAWHKFPSIVDTALTDPAQSGKITYMEHRLWYINGSTAMHLDLAEHDPSTDESGLQSAATLSTGRVGSGQWQVVYPSPSEDPASPAPPSEKPVNSQIETSRPTPPTSSILPVTTGAGRNYLLHFSPSNPQNMYLFQIPSSLNTATSIKDTIRDKASAAIASLPDKWRSGKHEWSRVEVVQASMHDGEIERPDEQLGTFAVTGWEEYGDRVVIWGGQTPRGVVGEGWVVSLY